MRLAFGFYPEKCPRDVSQCGGCRHGITCSDCGGRGCKACGGEGWVELERCAKEQCGVSHRLLRSLALARSGHWPAAGGVLDQCASFLDALEVFQSEWVTMEDAKREEEAEKRGAGRDQR